MYSKLRPRGTVHNENTPQKGKTCLLCSLPVQWQKVQLLQMALLQMADKYEASFVEVRVGSLCPFSAAAALNALSQK